MSEFLNEMIPDWLYQLVRNSKPVTQEIYDQLQSKNYSSGQPINIGDFILFGMLMEHAGTDENGIPNLEIKIIKFKDTEIGEIYDLDDKNQFAQQTKMKIPYLKYINKLQ